MHRPRPSRRGVAAPPESDAGFPDFSSSLEQRLAVLFAAPEPPRDVRTGDEPEAPARRRRV